MSAARALPPVQYTISRALSGLREEDVRRKGEQRGSVRYRGDAWYIAFFQWQNDAAGNLKYERVERRIEGEFSFTERGKKKAEQAGYDQWVAKANTQCKVPQGMATLEQFWEIRFQADHVDLKEKGGRVHYATIWRNHLKPSLGAVQLREITPLLVQNLVSAKLAAGYSSQTVKHIHCCLSAALRHARSLQFIAGELATDGVTLPTIEHKERAALTWEQVLMLRSKIDLKYQPLITILAQTGMRIGEAAGLRWKNVNLTDNFRIAGDQRTAIPPNSILVCESFGRSVRKKPKTDAGKRVIPMTAEAWVAFMEQSEASKFTGDDQPVFASRAGTPLDAHNLADRHVREAAKLAGIPWATLHCLRHTNATMADQYLTAAQKQKILGHTSEAMSTHYTHPQIEAVRQAMEKMTPLPKLAEMRPEGGVQ